MKKRYPNVVFFAADARYLQLAWLAAKEAAAQPERNFDVLLLSVGGPCEPPPGCLVLEVSLPKWVNRWPTPPHMSTTNYVRLFAAEQWLMGWKTALYLDSDIYISGPLAPLFELHLGGALAALSEDCGYVRRNPQQQARHAEMLATIGIDPARTFFNAGVMLFDIAAWRKARAPRHLPAFKNRQAAISSSVDQDFVNWLVRDRALQLSPRWNFQTHLLDIGLDAVVQPYITHYLDILKPWRDPEWRQAYTPWHMQRFAELLAAPSPFGVGPTAELSRRAHPDETYRNHVANVQAERAEARKAAISRISAATGRYIDLSPGERAAWSSRLERLLREPVTGGGNIPHAAVAQPER